MHNWHTFFRICRIVTFFPRYEELLRSSQDMQNCYILHRICRIFTFFTGYPEFLRSSQDIKKRCVLHMMCRNATSFTGYAEFLRVYAYVPVMHSPQNMQDTELQLSPPQGIGEGHLVTLTSQERVCIEGGYTALENILANCRFIR